MEEKTNKEQLRELFKDMIKTYEKLPPEAMITPINHYDFLSLLFLLSAFLEEDCKDDKSEII